MKLGIFTTLTRPKSRGDNYVDALNCYHEMADTVTIIRGEKTWPKEFSWPLIGQHFQKGYEQCDADWVIHCDIDFLFHQKHFAKIRQALKDYPSSPAVSFYKWQFTMPDRYNLKSRLVIAVNKAQFGDRIRFDSGGDLCQPSLDGRELTPDEVPAAGIPFYNYEKLLKTKAQVKDDVERMARAWHRHFGNYHLGTDETAYDEWLHMALGRLGKPHEYIKISEHPIYIQDTLRNLKPENWGYSAFGHLEPNNYVEGT